MEQQIQKLQPQDFPIKEMLIELQQEKIKADLKIAELEKKLLESQNLQILIKKEAESKIANIAQIADQKIAAIEQQQERQLAEQKLRAEAAEQIAEATKHQLEQVTIIAEQNQGEANHQKDLRIKTAKEAIFEPFEYQQFVNFVTVNWQQVLGKGDATEFTTAVNAWETALGNLNDNNGKELEGTRKHLDGLVEEFCENFTHSKILTAQKNNSLDDITFDKNLRLQIMDQDGMLVNGVKFIAHKIISNTQISTLVNNPNLIQTKIKQKKL